ncbi:MAG TPA: hypothetical protein VK766_08060 [Cytophagaceae bacterium]|nr:hypothetical protein [Cytophagaceae bacterium]
MKKMSFYFLVVVILIQCITKTAIVAYYEFNKAYIAAHYCENRAKPEMHCNGKCYLAKKIRTQENQESKIPLLRKEIKEITLFFSSFDFSLSPASCFIRSLQNALYVVKHYVSPYFKHFHPPPAN